MDFDKIRFDGKHVELEYKVTLPGGGAEDRQAHGEDPTPAFKAAIAAFKPYVVWVHSWPGDIAERIEIRGITIKRPDDEPRGIVVTALLKCPHARNSTSTFNTPYLAEPPANYSGAGSGFLSAETIGFIDDVENHGALFLQNGERGEQTALELGVNDEPAAKPKRGAKKKDVVLGVGDVMNPEATEVVDDEALRQLLLTVERDVPIDAIQRFTSSERDAASAWAKARQLEILNALKPDERVPPEPACIRASATLPLSAHEWTDPVEVALTQLDGYANSLLQHDGRIEETIYQANAVPVMDLLMIINPALDRELLTWQVNDELAHGDENAHELGWLIQRHASAIREAREKPIRRDDGDFLGDNTPDSTIVPDPSLETLEEDAGTPPLTFAGSAPDDSLPPSAPTNPTAVRGRGKKRKS